MADIETSVAITAQTGDLQSGMQAAANSVETATEAMKAHFAGLGAAAQQAQSNIGAAAAQIGSTIGALQAKAANLAGSVGSGAARAVGTGRTSGQVAGISVTERSGDMIAALDAEKRVSDAVYARKKAAIQEQAQLGKISATDEIGQLKELLDAKWALDQNYYEKKLAAAEDDARTREKLTAQEEVAYQKYLTNKQRLDTQAVQNSQKQWESLLQPIQRALDTSITGIVLGTTTVQKALSNLAQSIIAEFVNSAVKSVFGQLGKLLGASLAGGSGGNSGGDQDFWGGITGAGEDILGGGISQGVFGSGGLLGALGLGGLVSGGGVFGSLFKGIGSLFAFERGGVVPSAQGGWMVPSASLAMLHANEMVLPANISQGLQSMIASGGTSAASGGGANVVFNVSAMDSQSVTKFFQSNGSVLVAAINRAMRNGATLRSA